MDLSRASNRDWPVLLCEITLADLQPHQAKLLREALDHDGWMSRQRCEDALHPVTDEEQVEPHTLVVHVARLRPVLCPGWEIVAHRPHGWLLRREGEPGFLPGPAS